MAMDHFLEEVVIKKGKTGNEILFVLANIVMVVSALLGFMFLSMLFTSFNVVALIYTVVLIATAVLLYLFKDRLRAEYEYTFTNGDMDFAMVFNNQKRKSLGTMRVKNVEAFGEVESPEFQRYVTMPGIKTSRWFLNRGAKLYFFYFQKESNKRLIVIEPSEEMVDMIRKYLPRVGFIKA